MQIKFTSSNADAQVLVTDAQNIGPDKWRHAEVSGSASDETSARTLAEEIKQILANGREIHWRVPFEYKPLTRITHAERVNEWHLFGRFSFR